MILFPRGAGILYRDFAEACGAEALSLDTTVPLAWARDQVQSRVTVQGNLDPIALLAGGAAQQTATAEILDALAPGPFVFNLGHGILPQTPLAHVQALVEQVRAWRPRA
jgi:uroporphyrinogen decarboxylase